MPAVSVIVPVYNVEEYVDRCFESIIKQTFGDIEIIVINDGSTDKSGDKCLAWAERDGRIIYVSKTNEGAGPARNLGIQMASAEFVAFCDPDDWYDERFMEFMMMKQRETEADIVACGRYKYDGVTTEISHSFVPFASDVRTGRWEDWPARLVNSLCSKIFRKSIFADYNIKMPPFPGEDTAIQYFIITVAKSVAVIERPLYYYYFNRPGSQINCHRRYADHMVQILEYCWDLFSGAGLFDEYRKLLLLEALSNISQWYLKVKDDEEYGGKWFKDCAEAVMIRFGRSALAIPPETGSRIIGYGVLGKSAERWLPLLKETPLYPTEMWDARGDGINALKPDICSIKRGDLLLCFPKGEVREELRKSFGRIECMVLYVSDIGKWYNYWKIMSPFLSELGPGRVGDN